MNLDFSRSCVVTEFIKYANLFLFDSLDTQELTASLEMMHGQDSKQMTQEVFQQFFEWKSVKMKKLICVRNNMDITLQILADWFSDI